MDIIVYTSNSCGYCNMVKQYLKSRGIAFVEKNVSTDEEARNELIGKGYMSVPVVCAGDVTIVGFNREKLDKLLEQY